MFPKLQKLDPSTCFCTCLKWLCKQCSSFTVDQSVNLYHASCICYVMTQYKIYRYYFSELDIYLSVTRTLENISKPGVNLSL